MGFVIQWLCYLAAFVAGSAVAWVIVAVSIKKKNEDAPKVEEAPTEEMPTAELPQETGAS
ncbi:hypothetical protein [Mycobacterium riyadhense]|uniref:channel accessory protein ArfB n=1 Tax=Mycobacterium riyadhense TaxID=486698 RepID=UPI00195702CD|nr:hypothetical protein [Mycobacterium riyadhense]